LLAKGSLEAVIHSPRPSPSRDSKSNIKWTPLIAWRATHQVRPLPSTSPLSLEITTPFLFPPLAFAAIVPTLRAQNTSFMALASSVAALDLQLKQLKDDYRAIWREKTGSVQDPFKAKSREALERGVEGMEIR
jgi:hypothetical protein